MKMRACSATFLTWIAGTEPCRRVLALAKTLPMAGCTQRFYAAERRGQEDFDP
jgi:hypothetical protein